MSEYDLDLDEVLIDPFCAMRISPDFALERQVLPICEVDGDFIVAVADGADVRTLADIRRAIDLPVIGKRVETDKLSSQLKKVYGSVQTVHEDVEAGDTVSTVDYLLRMAFMSHASDIHFDPFEDGMRVRFRIDGELVDVMHIEPSRQASIASRLKVLGDLKLDERRAPQDGGFSWRTPEGFGDANTSIDIRVATLPGHYGERITLRLLEKGVKRFSLNALGMSEADSSQLDKVLNLPHGLILITGPTGSGKTTTLYAAIHNLLEKRSLNIITVENPIVYEIPGIFQAEIDAVDKVNFSKALRSILRHDPDVIMIGEIRDQESLDTAIKASLTGHLVLSTLHANDSITAVARLVNMGLERYLIADTLRLSMAQRLVRKICPHCRESYLATEEDAFALGCDEKIVGTQAYRARGCVYCAGRGMFGRMGLFELFRPTAEIAEAIASGVGEGELRHLCRQRGMRTLLVDGLEKASAGLTTLREVGRVAYLA